MTILVPRLRHGMAAATLVLLLLVFPHLACAMENTELLSSLEPDTVWNIEADKAVSLEDGDILEATGDVVLRQEGNYLKADFARYFRKTHWVHLEGHVRAGLGGDELEAEEAEFDLNKKVGWLKSGRIFLAKPHIYFTGTYVQKQAGNVYAFKEAKVTACDGKVPAWSFEADEGTVTIDGKAKLKNARFNIKDTPVLYTPVFSMSTKARTSGMLMPGVGYSNRLGAKINVPIYIVLDEENDITLYENLYTARGFMQGIEYRHNWDFIKGKGYWRFDYMYDNEIVLRESQEPSPLDDDGLIRTNRDRFWLRSMFNAKIPGVDVDIKLDLDFVSDQNYLREFKSGMSGFEYSRNVLEDEFHRTLNEIDEDRVSTLLASKSFDRGLISGMIQYTQPVGYGHGNASLENAPQLQKLPEFSAYLYKDRIPGLENVPLELDAEAIATNFRRNVGSTGVRTMINPTASIPIITDYGSIIASIGYRQTIYSIDHHEVTEQSLYYGEGTHDTPTREYAEIRIKGETEMFRVFDFGASPLQASLENVGKGQWTKLKHSIQPRVEYSSIPDVDQRGNPYFDFQDRLEELNQVTFSVTNVLTRKREHVVMSADDDPQPEIGVDYLDFLTVRFEQGYDFAEAERSDLVDLYSRRPVTDFLADTTLRLTPWASLNQKTWISPYLWEVTEHSHTLILGIPNWVKTSVGLDFQNSIKEYKRRDDDGNLFEDMNVLDLALELDLFGGLSVGAGYRTDIQREKDLEGTLSLSYTHQCFDITFSGTATPLENRVEAWVNLMGVNFF